LRKVKKQVRGIRPLWIDVDMHSMKHLAMFPGIILALKLASTARCSIEKFKQG